MLCAMQHVDQSRPIAFIAFVEKRCGLPLYRSRQLSADHFNIVFGKHAVTLKRFQRTVQCRLAPMVVARDLDALSQ